MDGWWKTIILNSFSKILASLIQTWKFTYETSQNSVNFLDFYVRLKDRAIFTDLRIKPTDSRQFLRYKLSRPSHVKN